MQDEEVEEVDLLESANLFQLEQLKYLLIKWSSKWKWFKLDDLEFL